MKLKLGDAIKEARITKNLTQSELAEGICTQATISNLEHNTSIPTVATLRSIAAKLMLNFNDLVAYYPAGSGSIDILMESKKFLRNRKYREAKKILTDNIDEKKLDVNEFKEYQYYLGICSLIGENDSKEAMYHFNLGMQEQSTLSSKLTEALTINGIAVAYFNLKELEKAKVYFEKAIKLLEEVRSMDDPYLDLKECVKIYYNTAKYYSFVEEFSKAIELCSIGISLQQQEGDYTGLEVLYYEKGFNLAKINELEQAKKMYFVALGLSEINSHEALIEQILIDAEEYNLNPIEYQKKDS